MNTVRHGTRKVAMTGAEHFWYILGCIAFGSAYFMKVPVAEALSELEQYRMARAAPHDEVEPHEQLAAHERHEVHQALREQHSATHLPVRLPSQRRRFARSHSGSPRPLAVSVGGLASRRSLAGAAGRRDQHGRTNERLVIASAGCELAGDHWPGSAQLAVLPQGQSPTAAAGARPASALHWTRLCLPRTASRASW